jgi:SAM-dependent methyltransferase
VSETDAIRAFDAAAEKFDAIYESPDLSGEWLRARFALALELLGGGPGEVLDAGMGPGRLTAELDQRGWTVWGVDGSANMVSLARARVPRAGDRLLEARIERLPFGDDHFDAVVSTGVLGYVDDLEVALRELARVLRPGGRLVFSVGNGLAPLRVWRERVVLPTARSLKRRAPMGRAAPYVHRRSPTRSRVEAILTGLGLDLEELHYLSPALLPDPLDRVFPRAALRLSRAADRLGDRARPVLALRIVVAARKRGGPISSKTVPSPAGSEIGGRSRPSRPLSP